ncbi:MAG TPA: hypothetical protein VMV10_28595 [Pirellulales bacterium]|nr:hypothetical protein [Pirellulales bacterium]
MGANDSTIRFTSFPATKPPPPFIPDIAAVFRAHEGEIATERIEQRLKSDEVLRLLSPGLVELGFAVESGKTAQQIIDRPVFFGENGEPTLRFEVDAYHSEWKCGLEVEATRAIRGGAFYRDLIQALVMVGIDHLCVAVPNRVQWGRTGKGKDYAVAVNTAHAIYGHSRITMPYGLTVIGY